MSIKVGFIGAGMFANETHFPTLTEMQDVEIVALCDINPEQRQKTAMKYHIPRQYGDAREMLDAEDMDAVFIVVPPKQLFPLAMEAFKRKKHVFMEKPCGMNFKETEKMAEAAEIQGCYAMVGFNRRFSPVICEAKRLIQEHGMVESCGAIYNKYQVGKQPYWDTGDWLLVDGIHALDTLRYLASSNIKQITPYAVKGNTNVYTRYTALLEFENGCIAYYMGNYNCGVRRERFEVHSEGASAYIAAPEQAEIFIKHDGFDTEPEIVITGIELTGTSDHRYTYGYVQEVRHFFDVVKGTCKPVTSIKDSVETMKLVSDFLNRAAK